MIVLESVLQRSAEIDYAGVFGGSTAQGMIVLESEVAAKCRD